MFGFLGLLGAIMAGFMVDALTTPAGEQAPDDHVDDTPEGASTGDLLDDPGTANTPDAGMPVSDDSPDAADLDEVQQGDDGNDILASHGGDDTLAGAAGNDQLGGRGGADDLHGGGGVDWLYGGDGADSLAGDGGVDDLHGDAGADSLWGGDGRDSLSGDGGRDWLAGGAGDDSLTGGEGDDSLQGSAGNDAVQGGVGSDLVIGGAGSDTLDGNDGNDTIWGDEAGVDDDGGHFHDVDFMNGGTGNDVLHVDAGDYASGGDGADQFAVHDIAHGDRVAQIMDFNKDEDSLVLIYDPSHHADPQITVSSEAGSPDATVMLDGVPVAQVMGGAGLVAADVILQAA